MVQLIATDYFDKIMTCTVIIATNFIAGC